MNIATTYESKQFIPLWHQQHVSAIIIVENVYMVGLSPTQLILRQHMHADYNFSYT